MASMAVYRWAGCQAAGSARCRYSSSVASSAATRTCTVKPTPTSLVTNPEALRAGSLRPSSSLQQKALDALRQSSKATAGNGKQNASEKKYDQPNLQEKNPVQTRNENEKSTTSTASTKDDEDADVAVKTPPVTPEPEEKSAAASPQPQTYQKFASPPLLYEFSPRILVAGVGGGGGNALNNMIAKGTLSGVDFLALNTDAQHLSSMLTDQRLQLGSELTQGLGCGANPDLGRQAAEESREKIREYLEGSHLVFITAGMGGGTGTGAAPVVAELCFNMDILTVGVVTLPFTFEGTHRRRLALEGLDRLKEVVDTLIVVPNQNLFDVITRDTPFEEAFSLADDVLLGGVKSISDLMTSPGLINLDFADVQAVMLGMGYAMIGTGVTTGSPDEDRAIKAATLALENPLLGDTMDISTAKGVLVNISGGPDMTLHEVSEAAELITSRIQDESANIMFGSAHDPSLQNSIRVSVVATGIDAPDFRAGGRRPAPMV